MRIGKRFQRKHQVGKPLHRDVSRQYSCQFTLFIVQRHTIGSDDSSLTVLNIDIEMLRSLNPAYRRDVVPGLSEPSPLRLPTTEVGRFIDMQDSLYRGAATMQLKRDEVAIDEKPAAQPTQRRTTQRTQRAVTVKVRRGDSLSAIARRNGTTVAKIKQLNGLRGNNIRVGQSIRVK